MAMSRSAERGVQSFTRGRFQIFAGATLYATLLVFSVRSGAPLPGWYVGILSISGLAVGMSVMAWLEVQARRQALLSFPGFWLGRYLPLFRHPLFGWTDTSSAAMEKATVARHRVERYRQRPTKKHAEAIGKLGMDVESEQNPFDELDRQTPEIIRAFLSDHRSFTAPVGGRDPTVSMEDVERHLNSILAKYEKWARSQYLSGLYVQLALHLGRIGRLTALGVVGVGVLTVFELYQDTGTYWGIYLIISLMAPPLIAEFHS